MKTKSGLLGAVLLAACATSVQAQASTPYTGYRLGASVYAGYMQFDRLFRATNGASFTNGDAAQVGVQGGVSLNSIIAVIGNLTYARTPGHFALDSLASAVGFSSDIDVWMLDADVQLRIPSGLQVIPLVQAGAGVARYGLHVNGGRHTRNDVEFNVGLGADIPLSRTLGLVVLARDYIITFGWNPVGDPLIDRHLDKSTSTNIGVSVGVTIGY
ncbi:MAG TPA: outer membrane beta-barrel protein [Gemmatimonadaceae bacterium]|nr:outer membrane beta-barrel protein [Gemmatimonadaceae bacterium]